MARLYFEAVSFWWYEIQVRRISTDLVNYISFKFIDAIKLKNNGTPLAGYQKYSLSAQVEGGVPYLHKQKFKASLRIFLENLWEICSMVDKL